MSQSRLLSFEEAAETLTRLAGRGWRMGLDRMDELCRRLDVQKGGIAAYYHVAGTNGKGSTTAFIQALLKGQGVSVGGYFSPYVYSILERVQYLGEDISRDDFAAILTDVLDVGERLGRTKFGAPTEFEYKTAVGFKYWKQKGAEAVALEVGLGGRLDATNVVDPAVSVIVSIGLDHCHILGPTHADIALEKAGIIKPGKPVVMGELPAPAAEVVRAVARDNGSPLWEFGREIVLSKHGEAWTVNTPPGGYSGLVPGIGGACQPHNLALAVAALAATGAIHDPSALAESARSAWLPGRFEVVQAMGKTFVLDGAHNEEASLALAEGFRSAFPGARPTLVAGMLQGHEPGPFFANLLPLAAEVRIVPIGFHRTRDPFELAASVEGSQAYASVAEALVGIETSHVLVTGSFYLLPDVAEMIQARDFRIDSPDR